VYSTTPSAFLHNTPNGANVQSALRPVLNPLWWCIGLFGLCGEAMVATMIGTRLGALVVFAHGKESGPWGSKIQHLASIAQQHDFAVQSLDYRGMMDPRERLRFLLEAAPQGMPLVLVGSSMGGWVSAMACEKLKPSALLLLAPALSLPGYPGDPAGCPDDTVVVHGWRDDVVPFSSSLDFARQRRAKLHLLDDDHGLMASLAFIGQVFSDQLGRCRERFS
jgi:alpha/beta superfamily hydrolase